MNRRRSSSLMLLLGIASFALVPVAPSWAAPTCFGRPVTIMGTAGADRLRGTPGPDVIVSLGGDDVVRTGRGPDLVCSGAGTDRIRGGRERDRLDGGPGPEDKLFGGPADDLLDGGRGEFDRLAGGPGGDVLNGGPGRADHAMYEHVSSRIRANLEEGFALGQGRDALRSIEAVHGGSGDDLLIGDEQDNDLDGFGGDDVIRGGDGDDFFLAGGNGDDAILGGEGEDQLRGENGDDVLRGGSGPDFMAPGLGNDEFSGGLDFDILEYTFTTFPAPPPAVVVDLAAGTASGQGADTFSGIEEVWGTDSNDVLRGNGGLENGLLGFGGDDVLEGRGGMDFLLPGLGNDDVDGGANPGDQADFLIYDFVGIFEEPEVGVDVDLAAGTAVGHGSDTLVGVEAVVATPRDDVLAGDADDNLLVGLDGDDGIAGRAGDDILDGDLLFFEGESLPGNDSLDGGDGDDLCLGGETTVNCESEMLAASQRRALNLLRVADMRTPRNVRFLFTDHHPGVR